MKVHFYDRKSEPGLYIIATKVATAKLNKTIPVNLFIKYPLNLY